MIHISPLPSRPGVVAFSETNNWTTLLLEAFSTLWNSQFLNIRLILFAYMLINTSAKDQINSLAPAPASLGVCLRGWRKPPPFNEGLFSLETAIHRDNESHPGALRELGVKVFTMRIWFLLCCYHFCAMCFVSFGSVWVFGSSLSFSPNYSYGEYNVFAIIEAYWQSNEIIRIVQKMSCQLPHLWKQRT